jgi:drug/metabolite transporter superfamily protein YnfA
MPLKKYLPPGTRYTCMSAPALQPSIQPTPTPNQGPGSTPAVVGAKPVATLKVAPAKDQFVSRNRLTVQAPNAVALKPKAPAAATALESKTNVGFKFRLTGLVSFFTTALTSYLFNPSMFVNHMRTLSGHLYRVLAGTKRVHNLATDFVAARKAGQVSEFFGGVKNAALGWTRAGVEGVRAKVLDVLGKSTPAAIAAEQAAVPASVAVRNVGLFGWYKVARAEGSNPLIALAKGFKRTVVTGGDMPKIVAHAKTMGGGWGKAFIVTGKAARLAPLLNVPIAVLDVIHARAIFNDKTVSRRLRNAKIGQAIFSSLAAVLSIAAFVVPAPLDAIALSYASYAGLGSLGWSIFSSRFMVNVYDSIGNFLHIGGHHTLEAATGRD